MYMIIVIAYLILAFRSVIAKRSLSETIVMYALLIILSLLSIENVSWQTVVLLVALWIFSAGRVIINAIKGRD
jgi:hypothetical protein